MSSQIQGKILSLLREIKLTNQNDANSFLSDFIIGNLGYQFWYSEKSYKILDDLALMIIASNKMFKYADYESISETIRKTLENNVINDDIFDTDLIFLLKKVDSLFEALRNKNYKVISKKLLTILNKEIESTMTDWVVLYPLSFIKMNTFTFESLGIYLLNSKDTDSWQKFKSNFDSSIGFNLSDGKNYNTNIIPESYEIPHSWLIVKIRGTESGVIKRTEFLVREFIACISFYLTTSNSDLHNYVNNKSERYCILKPISNFKDYDIAWFPLPFLQPSFDSIIEISDNILHKIDSYLKSINNSETYYKNRFEISTQFIHYALLANSEIEKFVHFYISIDALFGKNTGVNKSIEEGLLVSIKNIDPEIEKKAKLLFKLRNEIFHGGCSKISDWKGYGEYIKRFEVDPLTDIELISYHSIKNYHKYIKKRYEI